MVILQIEDQPPLIQAIFAGTVDEVKELIEYKQDVNYIDCEKRTPLHAAAFKGDAAITALLLKSGARVNAKDSKWVTPLHRACAVAADETVALLLRYQADVSARDRLWQTPLHIAAANNDAYNCVEQLLNYVPNLNVTDRSGRTALHHAAYNGQINVAKLLISRGCIINACDKKDCRPLHCAVQMGHVQVVDLLIKSHADINAKDRNQYTPLHVAAVTGGLFSGTNMICKLLLEAGAEVDAQNSYGNTPLHIACLNGHLDICQELVDAGARVEATNFRGQTPLHIAAASMQGFDCLMFLLRQNVDINTRSLDGWTPLHMTAIHGRFTRSKTLIDKGALIDCADKNGCTSLHIAARYGHDLLANTLLSYGANPNRKGYEGRTSLHMCCLSGFVECCRKFVQSGVDLNDRDDTGKTPTHCAAYKGSYECLDLLVSNGADFKLTDNLQRLPLHYAASQGHYQCVFTLVGIGSPVNVQDIEGCTPLHLAAAYDHEGKCVEYLLDHKADATMKDNRGFTPLHYAIAGGNVNSNVLIGIIRSSKEPKWNESKPVLDESHSKTLIEKDTVDITPLHLAAKLGNIDVLRLVLPLCEDVNVRTNLGLTPLILAAREGHSGCVHVLLRFGAKVALSDYVNNMTPVHYSAKNGHSQCLTLLLHNSEDQDVINMLDSQHRTALMLAVSGNHIECVQTLLKCGADPNIVDTDEHSCLFRAVVNGQNSIVQLLLSNNAKVDITDVNGKTVLHLAAACGHYICMQMIVGYMSENEVRTKDNQQCTALHWACYNGHALCVEFLLEKDIFKEMEGNSFSPIHCATFSGIDRCLEYLINHFGPQIVHLRDCRQRTPIHIAALHGHMECAKYLLDYGARVQVYDEDHRTPLIAAAQYGQAQVIDLLLLCNIDRKSCDKFGNTALHWACIKKYTQTALLLLEDEGGDAVVNIANNEKKTPLHIAVRNGLVEVTRELLKKGASVLAVDNEGLTPALSCAPNNNVAQCLALILQALPHFSEQQGTDGKSTSIQTNLQITSTFPHFLDSLKLSQFYQNLSKATFKYKQNDVCLQTDFRPPYTTLSCSSMQGSSSKKLISKSTTDVKQSLLQNNDDCFVMESKDYLEISKKEKPVEKLGFGLHKSYSDISIVPTKEVKKPPVVTKPRQCRECFRLQHRCSECSMRLLLKKHLTGRTNQRDFNEFLVRCFSETSSDYRRIFNNALEQVGRELNLTDNLKPSGAKSSGSITEQLAMLNKNRTLIGGMRRQNVGIVNRAGRVVRAKRSMEDLGKGLPKTDMPVETKVNEATDKASKKDEIFLIDKKDPVLKEILLEEYDTDSLRLSDSELSLKGSTSSEELISKESVRSLSVHSFIIDVKSDETISREIGDVQASKQDKNEQTVASELHRLGGEEINNIDEARSLLNIGNLDKVEQAFTDLDTMLQEIEMELKVSEDLKKKKKSKTDYQEAHNLQ